MAEREFESFTNDSSMMIAYERALETKREDALFHDPFAEAMAGKKGETLSAAFGNACPFFGFPDWPDFHKQWAAVRTRFIDDFIKANAGASTFAQIVNCGAGLDTRPYRLEAYKGFPNGAFDVDMETVNAGKATVFRDFLGGPEPHCPVRDISLDFLDENKTLASALQEGGFDQTKATVFVCEGLIMYLGETGKFKFLRELSTCAPSGSVLILNFLDASQTTPENTANTLTAAEVTQALGGAGWTDLEIVRFGDPQLSFGRFPTDKFKPSVAFSFATCRKA